MEKSLLKIKIEKVVVVALFLGIMMWWNTNCVSAANYDVWVGGKQVTSKNAKDVFGDGGSVKYNASKKTLTLKNALIQDAYTVKDSSTRYICGIYYKVKGGTFKIKLSGSNNIFVPYDANAEFSYGICPHYGAAKMSISGSGSLTLISNDATRLTAGINAGRGLTIEGKAKVDAQTPSSSTGMAYGIYINNKVTIKGSAKLTSYGTSGAFNTVISFGKGYTPSVKAGMNSNKIMLKKKKPSKKTYKKYQYIKISKAKKSKKKSSKVKPVKIKKVVAMKKRFNIYWKAHKSNCSGYQLQVSENKKFPKKLTYTHTVYGNKYDGTGVKGLSSGRRYYIRMRAFSAGQFKNTYGKWTKTRAVVAK
ncbi:MAG: hypothetical protein K6G85_07475 [Eubacterium sp.]|nr:hypothetical protein [Eubacterium sp.]